MGAHKKWFLLVIWYKLLDIITTLYLINSNGTSIESNPFVGDMINAYGLAPGMIANGFIACLLFYILYKYREKTLLKISAYFMMMVVIINTISIFIN